MTWRSAYGGHLREMERAISDALVISNEHGMPFDSVVFHSGRVTTYHGDDLEVPFRSHPHFTRLAPVPGPDHLSIYQAGRIGN